MDSFPINVDGTRVVRILLPHTFAKGRDVGIGSWCTGAEWNRGSDGSEGDQSSDEMLNIAVIVLIVRWVLSDLSAILGSP